MPHLIYDPEELSQARAIVVCVPGALARIAIFDPVREWRQHGYGLAFYPFPGLDGRPISPKLNIADAADEIVRLAQTYPDKPLRLLGYSTGAPVVISAAVRLRCDVKTAAMSPAVEGGGGLSTALPGLWDIVKAAGRARSLRTSEIWMDYYRVLLFGRRVMHDPELRQIADQIIADHRPKIVLPDAGKPRAHTDDLRHWRVPRGTCFEPDCLRLFVGLQDPVFSIGQTQALARKLGCAPITGYDKNGHLLFLSHPPVFSDVLNFFEGAALKGGGVDVPGGAVVAPSGAGNSE